ncbi:MAG: hypothetical protein IVW54_04495 [Candidatus Binataceae bacterium]|nr:hypothetical protein [Candidatus Binataceae bacterium]
MSRTIYASALILLCAIPVIRFAVRREGAFLALFSIDFVAYYGIPPLTLRTVTNAGKVLPDPLVCHGIAMAGLYFICVCIGYSIVPRETRLIPRMRMAWTNPGVIRLAALTMCAIGLAAYAILTRTATHEQLGQSAVLTGELSLYGIAILFTLQLSHRLERTYIAALWGFLIPARMLLGLSSGSAAQGLGIGLLLLTIYSELKGRMWWSAVIVGLLAFMIVRPAMSGYRAMTWSGGPLASASRLEKGRAFVTVMGNTLSGRAGRSDQLKEMALNRLCDLCVLSDVIHETPKLIPYWDGATYYPLLVKPIPRFVWAGKPKEDTGQTFGHRYGFLDRSDRLTAYNLSQPVEAYVNFGVPGIVIVALIFGLIYRFVELMFFHRESGIGAIAVGGVLLSELLGIDDAASGQLGGLMASIPVIWLICLIIDGAEILSAATSVSSLRPRQAKAIAP